MRNKDNIVLKRFRDGAWFGKLWRRPEKSRERETCQNSERRVGNERQPVDLGGVKGLCLHCRNSFLFERQRQWQGHNNSTMKRCLTVENLNPDFTIGSIAYCSPHVTVSEGVNIKHDQT
jgi:hypothetical protein